MTPLIRPIPPAPREQTFELILDEETVETLYNILYHRVRNGQRTQPENRLRELLKCGLNEADRLYG